MMPSIYSRKVKLNEIYCPISQPNIHNFKNWRDILDYSLFHHVRNL